MSGHAAAFLQACRNVIGDPPRRFSLRDRRDHLSLPPPKWVTPTEPFSRYFEDYKRVLREGRLVWGAVVQANDHLFGPGSHDHPAEIIYAPDPGHGNDLATLAQLAHRIFALKGTTPNDEGLAKAGLPPDRRDAKGIRAAGADGTGKWSRPRAFVGGLPQEASSFRVSEEIHLPVLVSPDPRLVMVLPEKHWPAGLLEWWEAALTGAPRHRLVEPLARFNCRARVSPGKAGGYRHQHGAGVGPRRQADQGNNCRATARARVIGPCDLGGRRSPQS